MISFNKGKKMFYVDTKDSTYIFGINSEKKLFNAYYGRKLNNTQKKKIREPAFKEIGYHSSDNLKSNFMPEINVYDGYNVFENTIKCTFSDGDRSVDYEYSVYEIKNNTLRIKLKDKKYDFYMILNYVVHYEHNLIEKSVTFENMEKSVKAVLETFNSGELILPAGKYFLGFFYGSWINEMTLRVEEISYGKKVLESRTGNSSHIHNPSFFISRTSDLSEDTGEIYYGQFLWSGNWKFVFERRFHDVLLFTGGINSFDGFMTLDAGMKFTTPSLIIGYSDAGLSKMTHNLHDFYRDKILSQTVFNDTNRVLVNSWEAFYFDINEEKLLKLADVAGYIGAEIFVVDDGWFRGRNDDTSSLGDWKPAKNKFPGGMKNFIQKVKDKGLKSGIWIEPEMVNPHSELYKKHPDWCYHFPGRKRIEMRHQLVLNVTKKEVKDYVKRVLKYVIEEFDPDYVKWDMNRYISQAGAFNLKNVPVWIEHTKVVYELMEYLKSLKPELILEGCAGGGGRFNGGIFKYVDQMWTSDNNDPFCRQYIQYGTSLFYPAIAMCCHVADSPYGLTGRKSKLPFRIHTAMAGNYGIEANLLKWSKRELDTLKNEIAFYKEIRDVIYYGDLYRMENPYESKRVSFIYVSKDKKKAALFVFAMDELNEKESKIRLKGLNPAMKYSLTIKNKNAVLNGRELMEKGIKIPVYKKQDSIIIKINKF
ncbi:MAG: alpha-galactosidase [Candidatus Goldbacteria bacterium]|nr:alpha-galactosidase [Candidatus Goldiibacteriota bacterium]